MTLNVSVVINTLNRASALDVALLSLRCQTFRNFEVIVVNGPSTDQTEAILEKYSSFNMKTASCPTANLSISRNIGISLSCGDIVSFIDDDAVAEPEWLENVVAGFDSPEIGAVGGMVYDHTGYTFQAKYVVCDRMGNAFLDFQHNPGDLQSYPNSFNFCSPVGTNCSFLRSALLKVKGFDEEYEYYLDETDVCLRIVDANYVVRFVDNAFVHHKFLPSGIRNDRGALKHRYPVLKNKYYFALRNATAHMDPDVLEDNVNAFFALLKDDAQRCFENGLISKDSVDAFDEEARRARDRARAAAALPRKLLGPPPSEGCQATTLRLYERLGLAPEERLTLVFLTQHWLPASSDGLAQFTYVLAVACAARGHQVHVLTRGKDHHRVDFEEGVWVHRIVVAEREHGPEAARLNIPRHIRDYSGSMLEELDRIGTHRPIDLVMGPLLDCEAIAALLSGRYRVVTSVQTTSVEPQNALEAYMLKHSHGILDGETRVASDCIEFFRRCSRTGER